MEETYTEQMYTDAEALLTCLTWIWGEEMDIDLTEEEAQFY